LFGKNDLPEFLQIFLKYIYAGQELRAWKFFDENEIYVRNAQTLTGAVGGRELLKERLIRDLELDPIYKFIKADLEKNN